MYPYPTVILAEAPTPDGEPLSGVAAGRLAALTGAGDLSGFALRTLYDTPPPVWDEEDARECALELRAELGVLRHTRHMIALGERVAAAVAFPTFAPLSWVRFEGDYPWVILHLPTPSVRNDFYAKPEKLAAAKRLLWEFLA